MEVKIDDEVLFEIDSRMISLLANDLIDPQTDIRRRLQWVIQNKCDQCYERIKKDWIPILMDDPIIESIPADKNDFLDLVFSRADYKNRAEREEG